MTPERVINPEVEMAAAWLVHPNINWEYDRGADCCVGADNGEIFVPLTSDADAWALLVCLMRAGWTFNYNKQEKAFTACDFDCGIHPDEADFTSIADPSDTLLLLKAVAAMRSLELYL